MEKMDTSETVELHPRKRKIKTKDTKEPPVPAPSTSAACTNNTVNHAAATNENTEQQQAAAAAANEQPMLNCFEMYLNIRKQVSHITMKIKSVSISVSLALRN